MADTVVFQIDGGSDWYKEITLKNDDGTLLNLAGCQAHMQVRPTSQSQTVLLDLSTAENSLQIDATTATISWNIPATQTATFQPQAGMPLSPTLDPTTSTFGVFDLLVKFPGGQITSFLSGQVVLKLGVTHPF
ncbi:hypothetical protein G3N95_30185 [Paraburkholderia sp. Tr-20389]|uniref:hypothetical protein n=1 Tax=Paraburkholderia sp. Tr-20389 TaxID=2703903 RepID=UPI0019817C16|nr:hypothetical protein [Paraburkholderia sp. Tr-20389]MBN3757245.1 hypothetical protein [Paraburkholderia sp. Tr-20389]